MKFPAYPSKGKLVADTVRDILNYIRATRITRVIGGKLKVTPNGTTIDVSQSQRNKRTTPHPFRLRVARESSQNRLYVYYGPVNVATWDADSTGQAIPFEVAQIPLFTSGNELEECPITVTGTVGYEVLSTSTTYGVWMRFGSVTTKTNEVDSPIDEAQLVKAVAFHATGPEIVVNSTHTEYTDISGITASTTGYVYHYIGKVAIDGSDNATITQFERFPIHLPCAYIPTEVISGDVGNILEVSSGDDYGVYLALGGDGGTGGNNLLTIDEGGIFLGDEQIVVSITGGTDISVSDGGSGVWTINYTGS